MTVLSKLTESEAAVFAVLRKAAGYSGVARRSRQEIAEAAGVTERTVTRSLARLSELDIVAVQGRGRVFLNPRCWHKGKAKSFAFQERDYLNARAGKWAPATAEAADGDPVPDAEAG